MPRRVAQGLSCSLAHPLPEIERSDEDCQFAWLWYGCSFAAGIRGHNAGTCPIFSRIRRDLEPRELLLYGLAKDEADLNPYLRSEKKSRLVAQSGLYIYLPRVVCEAKFGNAISITGDRHSCFSMVAYPDIYTSLGYGFPAASIQQSNVQGLRVA